VSSLLPVPGEVSARDVRIAVLLVEDDDFDMGKASAGEVGIVVLLVEDDEDDDFDIGMEV
jgi:hypothetical protein